MSAASKVEIIHVNAGNVAELGFFCLMSRRRSAGYQQKLNWLAARFAEGLRIKMLKLPARGFIEYIPGEHAWRSVNAAGYMVIHCLWVVGRSKGQGYATALLDECLRDAKQAGMNGVAIVTSKSGWLPGKALLLKHGFRSVDQAPPAFELLVRNFKQAPPPSFCGGWEEKARRGGKGLTVFRSGQCPYNDDAARLYVEAAAEQGIPCNVIELASCEEVREHSPYAYGVFAAIYNGKPLAYHHLLKKDIVKRLAEIDGS